MKNKVALSIPVLLLILQSFFSIGCSKHHQEAVLPEAVKVQIVSEENEESEAVENNQASIIKKIWSYCPQRSTITFLVAAYGTWNAPSVLGYDIRWLVAWYLLT